jgi:tryptophanyl-tRNA synthetase
MSGSTDSIADQSREVALDYLSAGLDPSQVAIFRQSAVPQHAELAVLLGMLTPVSWLERVPTYKEKREHVERQEGGSDASVSFGLLGYPVLQAADILLYRAHVVPVGKDQAAHLELTREIARRFNHLYATDVFPEPQAFNFNTQLVKVPGLTGGGKMSKSAGESDTIFLDEPAASLNKKIMRAVSDSGPTEPGAEKSQAVQNLFDLMSLVCTPETIDFFDSEHKNGSIRYGDLKKQLAADMETFIAPMRDKIESTLANEKMLQEIAHLGAAKARQSAQETMAEVREIIGFSKFYL